MGKPTDDAARRSAAAIATPDFQRGEEVEVRSLEEIQATLDARGTLDGIPFMPEMERFTGRRVRVWRRADRLCVEGAATHRRLRSTVFLENLRCDGSAHAGCQRACLLFWNEAWLRRASAAAAPPLPADIRPATAPPTSGAEGVRFFCQSTALMQASVPLPVWHPEQYLRDLLTGNLTVGELLRSVAGSFRHKLEAIASRRRRAARSARTPSESLGLAVGDWVQVKTLEEIEATLDARQCNRGLQFSPAMISYCGRRFRVGRRLERIIREATGEMRDLADTVVLENVVCDGLCSRGCPRANLLYWREAWLRRVPRP